MYFSDAVSVLRKRWYVLLVGMGLVVGGVLAAFAYVPTQHQATAHVLLLLPTQSTGSNNPTNPYLNLQPGLVTSATLIAGDLSTNATARRLAGEGFVASFAIGVAPDTGPLLVVTVEDQDPVEAAATRDAVVELIQERLTLMQADMAVPRSQFIFARDNEPGTPAEVLPGSRIRAGAAIGGVGTALVVLAAFGVERLARRRRARRAGKNERTLGEDTQHEQLGNEADELRTAARTDAVREGERPHRPQPVPKPPTPAPRAERARFARTGRGGSAAVVERRSDGRG